ncbi:adenylate kinase [Mycolicibacterium sp. CBMA 226]|uniref:adenylate kinase n=1 Tax=Mycolicibacterium sp. CBMA 226 TaxID=2606611 RepID=UPI0012DC80DD|nr:adenylate kinase [Mycolicibacterium sp. CBMA 226]MUL77109.1 adenylate kinase [Mycolicibacterium sp. CBMA 226]
MKRTVILGRGAAGKSTLAKQLSERFDLPLIELDALFWRPGPTPTPPEVWRSAHQQLISQDRWIIDGDLGDYDSGLAERLSRADTIVILDFPLRVCLPRALRRSRETWEFWSWLIRYRRDSLPYITTAARRNTHARTYLLRTPTEVKTFLADLH